MTDLSIVVSRGRRRLLAASFLVISLSLVVPTAAIAIALGVGLVPLPYELFLVRLRLPIVFPLHMIASGLALLVVPITALTRHRRGVHRAMGRLSAVTIVVGAVTALPVALASGAPVLARAGLFTQGAVWLALLVTAVVAIRRGDVRRHARLMLAVAAVTSGAIWLRLVIAAAIHAGLPFEPVYAAAAWACWVAPLVLAARVDIAGIVAK